MIISDSEKFVFVHNPKCGGMSWRNQLGKFDTRDNFFFEWKMVDENKKLDMAHITPFQLRRFYPDVFNAVSDYMKFGFVRNPYDRFCSAVSQHLKLGSGFTRSVIIKNPGIFYDVASAFANTVLKDNLVDNDHRLVHFKRQASFHFVDGDRWTQFCFKLENLGAVDETEVHALLPDLNTNRNKTGGNFESGYDSSRLSKDAIASINEFYARDFEVFDYEKLP